MDAAKRKVLFPVLKNVGHNIRNENLSFNAKNHFSIFATTLDIAEVY